MPRLIICFDNLSGLVAVQDSLIEVHNLIRDLVILEIKVPLAKLQVTLTQLRGILDLIVLDHFLKH